MIAGEHHSNKALQRASSAARPWPLNASGHLEGSVVFGRLILLAGFASCLLLASCGDEDEGVVTAPTSTARCTYVTDYDVPPRLVTLPQPVYPEEARRNGDEGVVHVRVGIGTDGTPCGAQIASSPAATLDLASLQAVLKAVWIPAQRRNQPVAVEMDVAIRYSLHRVTPPSHDDGEGIRGRR